MIVLAPAASALAASPEVRRPPSAMIGTPLVAASSRSFHHRGQLRHADTGDDARGADRARPDPDLDRIRPGIDQRAGRFGGGDVAGDHLRRIGQLLHPFHRAGDIAVVAVGGVDDDHVAFGASSASVRSKPLSPTVVAAATRRRPGASLVALGIGHRLFDVLDRDQADAMEGVIHHQQLFDPALVQQAARLFLADPGTDRREVLVRHQFAHRLGRIVGKAHVAVGEDADQLAAGSTTGMPLMRLASISACASPSVASGRW
jgi:hypothetical protein